MGTKARQRPSRLGEKLVKIRTALGFSQNQMIKRLGLENELTQNTLANYELGKREPTLITLLLYSRAAGVHMEALVDDDLDLPDELPGPVRQGSIERQYPSRRRKAVRTGAS